LWLRRRVSLGKRERKNKERLKGKGGEMSWSIINFSFHEALRRGILGAILRRAHAWIYRGFQFGYDFDFIFRWNINFIQYTNSWRESSNSLGRFSDGHRKLCSLGTFGNELKHVSHSFPHLVLQPFPAQPWVNVWQSVLHLSDWIKILTTCARRSEYSWPSRRKSKLSSHFPHLKPETLWIERYHNRDYFGYCNVDFCVQTSSTACSINVFLWEIQIYGLRI
jgi:hypothetical protein